MLKNIDCGYSLEPSRRGGSNKYPQSMFWAEVQELPEFFFILKFSFFGVFYLNRRVFVMWRVRPTDTQISLRFRKVWSKSLAFWCEKWSRDYVFSTPGFGSRVTGKFSSCLYGISLHSVFHCHPFIISIWHYRLKEAITKTCLYNFDPFKPHLYIVKLGFTGVYNIFLIAAQNIDCGYSLEPPRRGGCGYSLEPPRRCGSNRLAEAVLMSTHNLCFEQKYE